MRSPSSLSKSKANVELPMKHTVHRDWLVNVYQDRYDPFPSIKGKAYLNTLCQLVFVQLDTWEEGTSIKNLLLSVWSVGMSVQASTPPLIANTWRRDQPSLGRWS